MRVETHETDWRKIIIDAARQIEQTPGSEVTIEGSDDCIIESRYSTNNGGYLGTYYWSIARITPTGNGTLLVTLKEIAQ